MRNIRKLIVHIFSFMFCAIYMILFVTSISYAQGVQVPQVKENTFVYDEEKILNVEEKDYLNKLLLYLEEKTTIEFAVITTKSYSGMSIEDYAHDLFNTLRIGKSDKDNGILFLLSANEGHARLEIGYGLEDVLTDSICGRILDKYYVPNRENGKTSESLIETANGVLAVLGQKYNIDLVNNQEKIVKDVSSKLNTIFVIFLIVVIILVVIFALAMEDGTYGSSSGSSGGFFSSSSGGGRFGGGFSGGGGASR